MTNKTILEFKIENRPSNIIRAFPNELGRLFKMWADLADSVENKVAPKEKKILRWRLIFSQQQCDGGHLDNAVLISFFDAICEICEQNDSLVALSKHREIRIFSDKYTDRISIYSCDKLAEKIADGLRTPICLKS